MATVAKLSEQFGPLGFYYKSLKNSALFIFSYYSKEELEEAERDLEQIESDVYGHTLTVYRYIPEQNDETSHRLGCLRKALAGMINLILAERLLVMSCRVGRKNTLRESAFAAVVCGADHLQSAYFLKNFVVSKDLTRLQKGREIYEAFDGGRRKERKNYKKAVLIKIVSSYMCSNNGLCPSLDDVLKIVESEYSGEGGLICNSEDIDHENRKLYYFRQGYSLGKEAKSVCFKTLRNQISKIYKKNKIHSPDFPL